MASRMETNPAIQAAEVAARYLAVSLDKLSITKLTGDASTRSYYRARAENASVIVAIYGAPFDERELAIDRLARAENADPNARLTFANDPCAHIEVTELLLGAGIPVPRILSTSGKDAAMLLEDAGDLRLQDWLAGRSDAEVMEAYRHALEVVVRIQGATETALEADSICSRLAFDEAKLRWELGFFFANYFNRYLHLRLDQTTSNAVQADFQELCAMLAARPRVLVHRDFHARNLMMRDGKMFVIDHQDARMGPASYDVASLLCDPYTALRRDAVPELVEGFIAQKAGSKTPLTDVDEFRIELELMTVQRMLKAIGTYASQAAIGNLVYVPYIEPALERALAAMNSLHRFESTRLLLEQAQR